MSTQAPAKTQSVGRIVLKNVRLSYCNLFKARAMKTPPGATPAAPKFSVTCIMDKKTNADVIALVKKTIDEVIQDKWAGKKPAKLKICLRDGSEYDGTEGFSEDVMFLGASSTEEYPPDVRDCDKTRKLTAADHRPYSGCYGNVVVRLWAQDNDWGKRVNAALEIVQFAKHGEPLGASRAKAEDVLDDVDQPAEDEVSFED